VRGDVPPYAIAIGNPATVVRHRFDEATVDALLRLRWWDWDDSRLRRHLPVLLSDRVHELLADADATTDAGTGPDGGHHAHLARSEDAVLP
jgi:hypothetical protein